MPRLIEIEKRNYCRTGCNNKRRWPLWKFESKGGEFREKLTADYKEKKEQAIRRKRCRHQCNRQAYTACQGKRTNTIVAE